MESEEQTFKRNSLRGLAPLPVMASKKFGPLGGFRAADSPCSPDLNTKTLGLEGSLVKESFRLFHLSKWLPGLAE